MGCQTSWTHGELCDSTNEPLEPLSEIFALYRGRRPDMCATACICHGVHFRYLLSHSQPSCGTLCSKYTARARYVVHVCIIELSSRRQYFKESSTWWGLADLLLCRHCCRAAVLIRMGVDTISAAEFLQLIQDQHAAKGLTDKKDYNAFLVMPDPADKLASMVFKIASGTQVWYGVLSCSVSQTAAQGLQAA